MVCECTRMEMSSTFAEGSFANPDVDDSIVEAVVAYFDGHEQAYPWDVICSVSEQQEVSKKTVRMAVRKLRMRNEIVPAEPFVGEMELAE